MTGIVYSVAADGRHPVPGAFIVFNALSDIYLDPVDVSRTITDSTGRYALCGLPMDQTIYLEAVLERMPGAGFTSISAATTDAVADITLWTLSWW